MQTFTEGLTAEAAPVSMAFVGIGNTLAGDDGAGIRVIEELARRVPDPPDVLYHCLEGDLYGVADLLSLARRFVFIDACLGERPGEIVSVSYRCASQPSLHMTDIAAVMKQLQALSFVEPFPKWELRAITVTLPFTLGESLSGPVFAAVQTLSLQLANEFFPGHGTRPLSSAHVKNGPPDRKDKSVHA